MDVLDHVEGDFWDETDNNVRMRHVLLQSTSVGMEPASVFDGSCKSRDAFKEGECNLGVVGLDAWDALDA